MTPRGITDTATVLQTRQGLEIVDHALSAIERPRERLARLCDPAHGLGQSGVMVDRVLASLRWTAGCGRWPCSGRGVANARVQRMGHAQFPASRHG